jgi:hypothetical protein
VDVSFQQHADGLKTQRQSQGEVYREGNFTAHVQMSRYTARSRGSSRQLVAGNAWQVHRNDTPDVRDDSDEAMILRLLSFSASQGRTHLQTYKRGLACLSQRHGMV